MAATLIMPEIYTYKRERPKRRQFDSLDVAERQFRKERSESRGSSSSNLNQTEKGKQTMDIER